MTMTIKDPTCYLYRFVPYANSPRLYYYITEDDNLKGSFWELITEGPELELEALVKLLEN